jgi:hypothetical protein
MNYSLKREHTALTQKKEVGFPLPPEESLQIRFDHFLAVQETVFIDGKPTPFGDISQSIV